MTQAVKKIQYNTTRPTSVVIMLLLFQGIKLAFPKAIPGPWEEWTLNAITVIGGTGIIEKAWRNRDVIVDIFKGIWQRRKNLKRSADDSPGK